MHGRILGAALALLTLPATAQAEEFPVTISGNEGPGSLRAAVEQANAHANVPPETDQITIDDGLVIQLSAALPAIVDPVTIKGAARVRLTDSLAISGGDSASPVKLSGKLNLEAFEPAVRVGVNGYLLAQDTTLAGVVFESGSGGAIGGLPGSGAFVSTEGPGAAVDIEEDADVIVSDSTISATAGDAVRVGSAQAQVFRTILQGGTGDAGLELAACDDAQVITQNTIGGDGDGVDIAAPDCQVGGTGEDDGNTITGAAGAGVVVRAAGAQILGNAITDNGGDGVRIAAGGTARLRQNTIADNGGLGIDTGPDGPSGLRPTLTSAIREEGGLRVRGTAPAAGGFNLEVFASPACDPSGFGEGARNLGVVSFAVLAPGGVFDVLVPADTDVGTVATATLTGADEATTEFSGCAAISDDPGPGGPGPGGPGPGGTTYVPQSAISSPTRPRKARRLKAIKGTAVDAARVQVAVTRTGRRCKALTRSGKLKRRACARPRWIAATGTSTWKLKLKRRLPPGRYVIRSRATAPDGSVERTPAQVTVRLRT